MKVFVTGVNGQLGYDVANELTRRGYEAIGSGSRVSNGDRLNYVQLDITDRNAVDGVITALKPDAVIHCAAWTAVDAAEELENFDKVMVTNCTGTKNIAEACKKNGCKMVYISTDYVFNGKGSMPWKPDCEDYSPLNVYGKSKLEGELAVKAVLDCKLPS